MATAIYSINRVWLTVDFEMDIFFLISQLLDALPGFINHAFPAAEIKTRGLAVGANTFIYGMHITMIKSLLFFPR